MATRPATGRQRLGVADERVVEDTLVKLYRCATVVKGGRRFSFGALVVVGDRQGQVGYGYGKAKEVPPAVEKGIKQARRSMFTVPLRGTTIPHRILGRYGASRIVLIPAAEGTGVIAGSAPRAVLELAGVKDVLTKSFGSTSPKNLVKATINGLQSLRTRATVELLRGVPLDLPPEPEAVKPPIGDREDRRERPPQTVGAEERATAPPTVEPLPEADAAPAIEPAAEVVPPTGSEPPAETMPPEAIEPLAGTMPPPATEPPPEEPSHDAE